MKTTFITIFSILVLAAVALVVGPSFVDWSKYKTQAQEQIKALTGYDAEIKGDLSLALLPAPRLSVENLTVMAGAQKLVSFEKLDINLALAPLFSKKIVVNSVGLVKPDITITVLKNGKQNWMTPEIEALMAKKEGAQSAQGGGAAAVSLDGVSIKDGRFNFIGGPSKSPVVAEKINLDIAAKTLKGPFEIDGDLVFAGKVLELDMKAGMLEQGASSVSMKAEGNYGGAACDYAGAVGLSAPFESQGEMSVSIASLGAFLNNAALNGKNASLKGIVTASTQGAVAKNAAVLLMGQRFVADLDVALAPLSITASLAGQDTINLDEFLPEKAEKKSGGALQISQALPKTMSMPSNLSVRLNVSVPAALYQGKTYQNVSMTLIKQGASLKANVEVLAPGQASIDARTDLTFASKSKGAKPNTDLYGDPTLNIIAKVSAPNVASTAAALTGKNDLPYISAAKTGAFNVSASISPGVILLKPSTVRLDDESYKLFGSLTGNDLVANIDALGGQLIVKGGLQDNMQLVDMAVQVKHPSLPKAVQTLTKAAAPNSMLVGPVDFYMEVQQNGAAYTLSNIKAKIMNTSLVGSLRYDGSVGKPAVSGDITFGDLVIPSKGKSPAAKGAGGQWSGGNIDTSFFSSGMADLNIKANSIKFGKWDISKPALKFKLTPGALAISELKAGLFGGQLDMNADVTTGKTALLNIKSDAKLSNVQIEKLVDALAGNKIVKGKGVVSVDTQLSTSGSSQAALVKALGGQGVISGSDIVLDGFDVARFARAMSEESKAGDTLLGLWKGSTKGGSTSFDTLDGAYTIANGVVNISRLDLDGPAAAIGTSGNVNLPKWTIATAHLITVKNRDDVPPFTVNISGSLSNPAQTFAGGALQDYFSRKLKRKLDKLLGGNGGNGSSLDQLLGDVLGGGSKPPSNDNQAPPRGGNNSPEDELKDLLKGLF